MHLLKWISSIGVFFFFSSIALAQHEHHDTGHSTMASPTTIPKRSVTHTLTQHPHVTGSYHSTPTNQHATHMRGLYGNYPMTRESSGTSWQPQATPFNGWMFMKHDNRYMVQGFINQIYDHQGGPRGGNKNFSNSMFMFMAATDFSSGTLGFRGMVSTDPLMGPHGYPLLLQTGETANGKTPLIDKQHPHDFLVELAGTYSIAFQHKQSVYLYVGLVGEPALGPPTFMMRWSSWDNPEAPITHHWLDSTHITTGVLTAGYIVNKFKFEMSAFNGRESDQARWNLEKPAFNSQAARLSFNPNDNWALQISYGHIISPEALEPDVNTIRLTASAMYNKAFGAENNWQTIFAWGQNKNYPGHVLNGYLLESAVKLFFTHTFFGRIEHVQKDELFVEPSPYVHEVFMVNEFTLGYLYEFPTWHHAKFGLGALGTTYALPSAVVNRSYGGQQFSYMLFARASIA